MCVPQHPLLPLLPVAHCPLQVYVARWRETQVAVKILLSTVLDMYSQEAMQQALTLSNPILQNLQKVGRRAGRACVARWGSVLWLRLDQLSLHARKQ